MRTLSSLTPMTSEQVAQEWITNQFKDRFPRTKLTFEIKSKLFKPVLIVNIKPPLPPRDITFSIISECCQNARVETWTINYIRRNNPNEQ